MEHTSTFDLLDNMHDLPDEVQDILSEFSELENDYLNCAQLVDKLNAVGYTIEYGLDAEPYNLTKLY